MTFVQIIDCKTDRVDDMSRLLDKWVEQTHGKRTATHATVAMDRADTKHLVEIVEFPSYEEAMRSSNLPETDRIFQEMVTLCESPPRFTDLEVVRDEQLNKMVSRRWFDTISGGPLDALDEILSPDYHDHDPSTEEDVHGIDGARAEIEMFHRAFTGFRFTIDDQLAEGDQVSTRWTWHGTHTGEFLGIAPTNRELTMTGQTVQLLRDGRIAESWWNYDFLGVLRQMGIVEMPSR